MNGKFLILLPYYNRPNLVRKTLQSVKESIYTNWELAIVDDGSDSPIEPIISEMFTEEEQKKIKIKNSGDSIEQKHRQNGSRHGEYLNMFMNESDAEFVFMLCDDDAILPDYMSNLLNFYRANPNQKYAYCQVFVYNPLTQDYKTSSNRATFLNKTEDLRPSCQIDSSQVSWRKSPDIKFPSPQTEALDSVVFEQMFALWGLCKYIGVVGQYKGIFEKQLGTRKTFEGAE